MRYASAVSRVVLISLDGFASFYWTDPRVRMPTLRRLAERGVVARRMECVFPSTTWPTHASMVTGVRPDRHGVVANYVLNRESGRAEDLTGDPIYDADRLLRAPTVYDVAHAAGSKVTFMAGGVPEAARAAECGADVIIAQGTEGGGHVGWQTTMTLVPMVVDAVAPIPVLAAGGIADGRGLAAAIMLGADGVLLGTRFLASRESSLHPNFKQAILESDGHDTLLSEIPDIAAGLVWPGAMSRSRRNRFIERWAGREWALRQRRAEAKAALQEARKRGDADEAVLSMGQDAGLICDIAPAAEIVSRIAQDAERILTDRATRFIRKS